MSEQAKIKLSVFMLTYNHAHCLSRALDSVLSQQHNFPFEIVIGDDKSKDGTRKVIADYKKRYPGIIKPLLNWRNLGVSRNAMKVFKACHGEYIAFLDGDDYWTDPLKINKQIQFLDTNRHFVLSCHRYEKYLVEEKRYDEDHAWPDFFVLNPEGFELNPQQFFTHWFTQPLTVVFRREALDIKEISRYKHFKDVHLFYHLLRKGKGFVHSFFGGVYTIHRKGLWNGLSEYKKLRSDFMVLDELIRNNRDDKTLQWAYTEALIKLFDRSRTFYKYPKVTPEAVWIKHKMNSFEKSDLGYLLESVAVQKASHAEWIKNNSDHLVDVV